MFIKLMRLGADAESRQAGDKTVVEIRAAYNVGYGEKAKTQWVKLSCWRDNAPVHLLTKGTQIVANIRDLYVEEYQKDGKTGYSLRGTLVDFEFAGSRQQDSQPQQQQYQQPQQQHTQQQYQQPRPGYNNNGTQQSMTPVNQPPTNGDQFDDIPW